MSTKELLEIKNRITAEYQADGKTFMEKVAVPFLQRNFGDTDMDEFVGGNLGDLLEQDDEIRPYRPGMLNDPTLEEDLKYMLEEAMVKDAEEDPLVIAIQKEDYDWVHEVLVSGLYESTEGIIAAALEISITTLIEEVEMAKVGSPAP